MTIIIMKTGANANTVVISEAIAMSRNSRRSRSTSPVSHFSPNGCRSSPSP